ncbi:unnamed protein product [Cuscuta epithymum]|uniref:RBR-type E3 ubiquitin transferase n=1 Tax=Cuscuta epithymum TaxID=186058 RepID=A0AAV0GL92_9ASTE|nr:unnamed protein product [Cuscuta epithymum]
MASSDSYVDDFYFSALYDADEIFPVSDEKYAEELQLQEALVSSSAVVISPVAPSTASSLGEYLCTSYASYNQDSWIRPGSSDKNAKKSGEQSSETGESSEPFCGICMDKKPGEEMFRSNSCRHSYCTECIGRHVAVKIQENISSVKCPDVSCRRLIDPHLCRSIVPKEVFERWDDAICESLILGSQKFYCPFRDCSAIMVDDGEEEVTVSECPECRRLFCARCRVVWHAGIDCEEYQALNEDEKGKDDVMMLGLAKEKQWRRCPFCRFYVEKKDGCLHITCRCGQHFCYGCGAKYTSSHSCQRI